VRLHFGLAAWSNSHFDNALFPLRTPHEEYLPRYATKFDVAEADVLHHRMPNAEELVEWAAQAPTGFRFLPKMHKAVTHEGAGPAKAKAWLEALAPLCEAGKLGPVLLQFPASLDRLKGAELLQDLLRLEDPGFFAVEVRSSSWFTDAFRTLLEDHEAILAWSTFPGAFTPPWATAGRGYVRFTGKFIHKRGRHVTVADRLADVLEVRKRLEQASWREADCIVTNPFEGNAVDSLPRIAAALAGPEEGKRFAHRPGEVLFPGPPEGKGFRQATL
jgi:uncharacterized protein YecE (DUF72 family)